MLGNRRDPAALPSLSDALRDPDPIVRGHAAWAIGRIEPRHTALATALRNEDDTRVRAELEHALAGGAQSDE